MPIRGYKWWHTGVGVGVGPNLTSPRERGLKNTPRTTNSARHRWGLGPGLGRRARFFWPRQFRPFLRRAKSAQIGTVWARKSSIWHVQRADAYGSLSTHRGASFIFFVQDNISKIRNSVAWGEENVKMPAKPPHRK